MNRFKKLSLRVIVLISVSIILLVFTVLVFTILYMNMPGLLLQAEDKYMDKQRDVVQGVFTAAVDNTFAMAEDVGVWNETVRFVEGTRPDYFAENWPDGSMLESYKFNFILMKDKDGRDVYGEFYDYNTQTHLPVPEGFSEFLAPLAAAQVARYADPAYRPGQNETFGYGGIVLHGDTPYLLAVVPVMNSRDERDPAGAVIMGNILDNTYLQNLSHYDTIDFAWERDGADTPENSVVRESDIMAFTTLQLEDIDGNPIWLVMSDSREIYQEGQRIIGLTTMLLIYAVAIFAVFLYLVITRLMINPIEQLSGDIETLDAGGALDTKKYETSNEYYSLSTTINGMLARLNQSNISLSVFTSILDGLDACIYVTDIETDEILFLNKQMKLEYGCGDEAIGKECWSVLQQGIQGRCDFCPLHRLDKDSGETVVWEEHSTVTGRHYRNYDSLIDWTDRKAHMQHSIDITESKNSQEAIQRRLAQQELMSAMSRSFISTENKDTLINNALKMAGEFMNVSQLLIAQYDWESRQIHFKYRWQGAAQEAAEAPLFPDGIAQGNVFYEQFVTGSKSYVAIDDTGDDDKYAFLASRGIQSCISVSIHTSAGLWGILSFIDCEKAVRWSESDIQLALLIGGVISGVLERSTMEENLVRMSSIVNSSPQYIAYNDLDGNFLYINPAVSRITGYTEEELMAGGVRLVFSPETYRTVSQKNFPEILRGEGESYEYPMVLKGGEERIMAFSTFTTQKENSGIGVIALDMTEQRLMEKDLIQARIQAEESSKAKGDFLSRMSHEMRTPLNAIIGMTNIGKSAETLDKKEYSLDKIGEASTHLLGVVNDILDMSKIESGKFELSNTNFDLRKMLDRVIDVMNFKIEEKNQTLYEQISPEVPQIVFADEQRLAQVITNLLSNAVKFTPDEGSIVLQVKSTAESAASSRLLIEVIDSGIGISEEQQKKLFRSFEQADGGISRRFGGTGLGLAISKSIVEMMGGRIWVESELDKGSSFKIDLALQHGELPAEEEPGMHRVQQQDGCFEGRRILLAEDVEINREIVLASLEHTGITIDCAEDGIRAIELYMARPADYDLILMDIHMPEMDGYEATRNIRKLPLDAAATVPIVAMTANVFREDVERCLAAGMDDHIGKPIDFDELVLKISNHLHL